MFFLSLLLLLLFLNLNYILHIACRYADARLDNLFLFWWLYFDQFDYAPYFRIIQALQMVSSNIFEDLIEQILSSLN